ncbi:MAG: amphi-Trp domain-containing protein, partial [Humidesulfovibrio sp.]|nr:amphi-Trp domain-containing protein [Humidesulfovibrio sp.]
MEKEKIELKTVMETAEVADYLTALAKGFRAGRIVVEKDGEHLVLNPAAMSKAEVEIEARIKKDKAKFSLELSWQLATEQDECAEFKIGTELPEPKDAKGCDSE